MANPFLDDDEITSSKRPPRGGYDDMEDSRRQIFDQINASEDRQLESTRRALSSIYDSERMGVATAEELLRQGEQLDNIEGRLTEMDKNMTTSQRHINSIKSVFGGIKNWWSGKKDAPAPDRPAPEDRKNRLHDVMDRQGSSGARAGPRNSAPDCSGFAEDDLDSRFMAGSRKPVQNSGYGQSSQQQYLQPVTGSSREEEMNDNLGLMSDGMSRLKDLALGLGDEISRQNDQIDDRIAPRVDKVNLKVENQNKQMRRILHNK